MGYENTLILLLFDMFECDCSSKGIIDEDFRKIIVDEIGIPISEKEYLIKNKFYNSDMIACVLYSVMSNPLTYDHNELLKELLTRYFIFNYEDKSKESVLEFIRNSSFDMIFELFENNNFFGIDLFTSYFDSIRDEKKYFINRGKVLASDSDFKVLKEYDNNINPLNRLLKESVVKLYNNYINSGFSDIDALSYTWAYFTHNFMPDELFDEDTEDLLLEPEIKRYSLSLIYADLYEHAMNQKMSHSENEKENIASFLPILIVSFSMQVIPNDVEVRNRLLKHFILLQDDKEQMKDNRINTYKNEKFITLSKYNPYFTGDEIRY